MLVIIPKSIHMLQNLTTSISSELQMLSIVLNYASCKTAVCSPTKEPGLTYKRLPNDGLNEYKVRRRVVLHASCRHCVCRAGQTFAP